jgi:hypothetical protein
MAQEYPPRRFFRNAPNLMLQRYFAARNVLSKVDFSALSETQVARLWTAHGDPLRRRHIRLSELLSTRLHQFPRGCGWTRDNAG